VEDDDDFDADALAALSDEELEAELTIAASRAQRDERYNALLAEQERRRGGD
jgi:hypothetical protein